MYFSCLHTRVLHLHGWGALTDSLHPAPLHVHVPYHFLKIPAVRVARRLYPSSHNLLLVLSERFVCASVLLSVVWFVCLLFVEKKMGDVEVHSNFTITEKKTRKVKKTTKRRESNDQGEVTITEIDRTTNGNQGYVLPAG